jgi:hypothetical protein
MANVCLHPKARMGEVVPGVGVDHVVPLWRDSPDTSRFPAVLSDPPSYTGKLPFPRPLSRVRPSFNVEAIQNRNK